MNVDDKALLSEIRKGICAEIEANNKIVRLRLDQILTQTQKTNGRVTKLEDQTGIIRWFERKPSRFVLLLVTISVIGLDVIVNYADKLISLL